MNETAIKLYQRLTRQPSNPDDELREARAENERLRKELERLRRDNEALRRGRFGLGFVR